MPDIAQPLAIGSDHAGFEYKAELVNFLEEKGLQVKDMGLYENNVCRTIPILRTQWPMPWKKGKCRWASWSAAAAMAFQSLQTNTRASGRRFAGSPKSRNLHVRTTMLTSFAYRAVLLDLAEGKRNG